MTSELLQQLDTTGGIVDLSSRAKFRLTGMDRVRYLNGQVTNDVRLATSAGTLYACVTDIKGRIVGDAFIHSSSQGDELLVDAEADLREPLAARLERYIIADEVEFSDVSDDWQLWHVFGPAAAGYIPGVDGVLKSSRLGVDGVDIWLPASAAAPTVACPSLSAADFESCRILRGIPRHPSELNSGTFPPEAGIEARAMSYTKGCYLGQEILSRIRTTGRMPRELVRWRSSTAITPGESVFPATGPGEARAIGTITSATWHPVLNHFTGLAFVKQGSAMVDSKLPVGADTPRIDGCIEIFAFVN